MTQERTCHIVVIPGDGIGQEVIREGLRVPDFLAETSAHTFSFTYDTFPWSCQSYLETGHMMPSDGLQLLENFSALYFGLLVWLGVPDHISLWGLRLNTL